MKEVFGYNDYNIDIYGNVFDSDGIKRNVYRNGDGYLGVGLRNAIGMTVTVGIHRLLKLTYDYIEGCGKLTVNHLDGDIENNDLDNLEWETNSNNIIHAALIDRTTERPRIQGLKDNFRVNDFRTLFELSEFLRIPLRDTWRSVRDSKPIDGILYTPVKRNESLKPLYGVVTDKKIKGRLLGRPVTFFDIDTGETLKFNSLFAAASFLNVSASHVFQLITKDKLKICLSKYIVKDGHENIFDYTSAEIKSALDAGRSKEVIVKNLNTKEITRYPSAGMFIKAVGLSKKSVTVALRKGILKIVNGYIFTYSENLPLAESLTKW